MYRFSLEINLMMKTCTGHKVQVWHPDPVIILHLYISMWIYIYLPIFDNCIYGFIWPPCTDLKIIRAEFSTDFGTSICQVRVYIRTKDLIIKCGRQARKRRIYWEGQFYATFFMRSSLLTTRVQG